MAISKQLADIYRANPSGSYYIEALSIYHTALVGPIHATNASVGFSAKVDGAAKSDFISLPFSCKLPDKDTSGSQAMSIAFSNVEQDLVLDIEKMSSQPYQPAICVYRVFINGAVDVDGDHIQQLNPAWRYSISTFKVMNKSIVASATKVNLHNSSWPKVLYQPNTFPGLDK